MVLSNVHSWHQTILDEVGRRITNGELGHSQLLSGELGIGKLAFAESVAARLLCELPNGAHACGQCKQCQLFMSGNHSDYAVVRPEEKSRTIKIDAIRNLTEFLGKSSLQGGAKVAVIEPAEAMNINAANALLKTLEEPANNTYLLLVTHNKGRLLPTIKSRCQEILLAKPDRETAIAWLSSHAETSESDENVALVLDASNDAPLNALALLEAGCADVVRNVIPDLMSLMKSERALSAIAEAWDDEHLGLRLRILQLSAEQVIRLQASNDANFVSDQRALKMFGYLTQKVSVDRLFALRDAHVEQQTLLAGMSNPNPRLVLEYLLGLWKDLMRKSA